MRVFFSAGEASGDAYAAELLKVLQPEPFTFLRQRIALFRHDNDFQSSTELYDALREEESQIDPLSMAELALAVEAEAGIEIPDDMMRGMRRPEELIAYISNELAIRSHADDIAFEAVGGKKVESAGAHLVADSSAWGAVGILESLKVVPRVIGGFSRAKRALVRGRPGLFVPIDFGYMNVKLARFAKRMGWKVLYFIPPGSWRKTKQGSDLPHVTDAIVTPFPWSAEMLNQMGANAHYFGHPLKEMVAQTPDVAERKGIAVLPGSRSHEIESNVPVIATAIKGHPGPVTIALAANADEASLRREWAKWSDHEPRIVYRAAEALKASRSAIVCSGTATLEAALCGCPCVVMYRGNWVMEIEFRIRKPKFDHISLPNILLDRPLLKELLQHEAHPDAIRAELEAIDAEGPRRQEILTAFAELNASLGEPRCLELTAELARTMLAGD